MAKFLRVIFNLLLICYIAAAIALFVPPLVGVTTAVTLDTTKGNQEIGTVNYGWRTPLRQLQTGDEIILTGDDEVNVYTVLAVDTDASIVTVTNAAENEIPVRTYVYKSIFAVPYLGYIAIMLQTQEGMIILGAVAGVLLLLCIITAIWARKRKAKRMKEEEEELEDEKDNEFFQNLASQKRESDARAEADYKARQTASMTGAIKAVAELAAPALDEEYEELPAAEQEVKAEPVPMEMGDLDEAAASDEEDIPEKQPLPEEETPSGDTQADETEAAVAESEETGKEVPEKKATFETSEEPMAMERVVGTGNIPGVQAALEAALDTQQIQRHVRRAEVVKEPEYEAEPLSTEEIELAMPVYTTDELLQKAYAKGKDPMVKKDELTGVTYVDYSDCL